MWHKDDIEAKYTKKTCDSDKEIDSGFLSGPHSIIIDDRPIEKKREFNNVENIDSGYIEDEIQNKDELKKINIIDLTNQFNSLNIKTALKEDDALNVYSKFFQKSGGPNKKNKWEIYYQQNDDGDTYLHWACLTGFVDVVAALIRMTPHPCLLDIQNDDAQTSLYIAAFSDQPKIIRMLLIAGADPTLQDHCGNTPLHIACLCGNLQCVRALTENINVCELKEAQEIYLNCQSNYGVLNNKSSNSQFDTMKIANMARAILEMKNYDGERCVHLAVQGGFVDILRQLISCGADINAREGKSGRTSLHIAIQQKNETVVNFFLEEGLQSNLNLAICNYAGITAFQFACLLQNQTVQKTLQKLGADTEKPDSDNDLSDVDDDWN